MMKRLLRFVCNQRGLSLVEVLVAAVVIAIAALGTAVLFATGQAYITAEGDNRTSLTLAQDRMERLRALGYAGLVGTAATGTDVPYACPTTWVGSCGLTRWTATWGVTCLNQDDYTNVIGPGPSCASTEAKQITVTVKNASSQRDADTTALVTVLSPR